MCILFFSFIAELNILIIEYSFIDMALIGKDLNNTILIIEMLIKELREVFSLFEDLDRLLIFEFSE